MAHKPALEWIAEYWKEPLKALLSLDLAQLRRMAESIRGAHSPAPASKTSFVDLVATQVDAVAAEELKPVVQMIVDLEMTRAEELIAPQEFAEAIVEVCRRDADLKDVLAGRGEAAWESITSILGDMFSNPETLGIVSKGSDIVYQNERNYYRARILTDLRPVFGDSPDAPPKAFVAQHTLKIGYSIRGDFRNFFIALDSSDLDKLKEVVDRALKKDRSLREFMASKAMRVFE